MVVDAERFQARLASGSKMAGMPVDRPVSVRSLEPPLGGHEHVSRSGDALQRSSDEALVVADVAMVEAVDVGGVDERHPRVERGMDDPDGFTLGWATGDRERHRSVSNRAHHDPGVAQTTRLHQVFPRREHSEFVRSLRRMRRGIRGPFGSL